jgi:G3E family GTPase
MIPITIITGFLGSGKTTLLNQIIAQNPTKKFGLIINEFGEVGVDSELVSSSGEEITEMSNGCLCCVVRSDLISAVKSMIATNKVDHLLIETSGLAEPEPIAQTFIQDDIDGQISLDAIICLIDAENFDNNIKDYKVLKEQLSTSDIAIINKINPNKPEFNSNLTNLINGINPHLAVLENTLSFNTQVLLDYIPDTENHVISVDQDNHHNHEHTHNHEHNHEHGPQHSHKHHHEHEEFDEVLFKYKGSMSPEKLDKYFLQHFPKNVIRAKGFLKLEGKIFLFQMVGANKNLTPYTHSPSTKLDPDISYLILIGKDLDKAMIIKSLEDCRIL